MHILDLLYRNDNTMKNHQIIKNLAAGAKGGIIIQTITRVLQDTFVAANNRHHIQNLHTGIRRSPLNLIDNGYVYKKNDIFLSRTACGMLRMTLCQRCPDVEKSFVYVLEFLLDLTGKIVFGVVYTKHFGFMVFLFRV